MHFAVHGLAIAILLATHVTAQKRTLVVDPANGPYYQIQAAIDAANPGDVVSIRPGTYRAITITKPIAIIGSTGVLIRDFQPAVTERALPSGSALSLQDVRLESAFEPFLAKACAGSLVLEDVVMDSSIGPRFEDCSDVRGTRCVATRTMRLTRSNASFDRCRLSSSAPMGTSAVDAHASTVTFSRCELVGSESLTQWISGPAISSTASLLILTSDGSGLVRAGIGPARSAIEGSGVVLLDRRVVLRASGNAPAIASTLMIVRQGVPSLLVDNAPIGQSLFGQLVADPGDAYLLTAGKPAAPTLLPGAFGLLWMHEPYVAAVGVLGGTGRATWTSKVPNDRNLVGEAFVWQALTASSAGRFVLSNPATYAHRL